MGACIHRANYDFKNKGYREQCPAMHLYNPFGLFAATPEKVMCKTVVARNR